jgi:serine/threonine protein kinase
MAERCVVCGETDEFAGGRCGNCGSMRSSGRAGSHTSGGHTSEPTVAAGPASGSSAGDSSEPTVVAPPASGNTSGGSTPTGGRRGDQHWAPGTVLAGRYRVVAPIGRGGMGLVYRAEDLKLGETVALKFLPAALADDPVWLERFYGEVRTAREVTHPNVCRVHDLVEFRAEDGRELRFLTMEYVDGENLADLLRRFGRLPTDKAMELAGQITAALAAAHSKGVLHRDIKPANVMIDGRGQAKLADFGLAIAGDQAAATELAGTPGYIAPELLRGGATTGRSDLYALGLVLYELLTGRKAVKDGKVVTGSVREYAPEVPVVAERAVLQCLEADPAKRPVSAGAVLVAFPAKNALEAAMARGETPSPEMVADSADETPMELWKAWALVGTVAALIVLSWVAAGRGGFYAVKLPQLSPDEMRGRAQQYLRDFGYPTKGTVQRMVLVGNFPLLDWYSLHGTVEQKRTFQSSPQGSLLSWYQQAQSSNLMPEETGRLSRVTVERPPADRVGAETAVVDSDGNLLAMAANPVGEASAKPRTMDWASVVKATGLDPASVTAATAEFTPAYAFDERRSWTGWYPGHPEHKVSVDAAAWQGRLNYLRVTAPWNLEETLLTRRIADSAFLMLYPAAAMVGFVLAVYNMRRKRGDVKGATRLALFLLMISVVHFFLSEPVASHQFGDYLGSFFEHLAYGLYLGAFLWVAYVAIEPLTRKQVPQLLVGSTLVLQGRWRTVRVGREILVGTALGAGTATWFQASHALQWGRWPGATLDVFPPQLLMGARAFLGDCSANILGALLTAAEVTVLFTLFLAIFRKRWIAISLVMVGVLAQADTRGGVLTALVVTAGLAVAYAFVLLRVGLVALVVAGTVSWTSDTAVWPHDWSSWTVAETLWSAAIMLGVAGFGFWLAIGGQKPLGNLRLEE